MNKEINFKNVLIIFIILVLIFANLIVLLKMNEIDAQIIKSNQMVLNEDDEEDQNQEYTEKKLEDMEERDRMEYYFYEFISLIHDEKYSEAYGLLYPEFKERYFKTEEEFIKYVKKLYPSSVGFSYNDINRQGNIYVLSITVIDVNKGKGKEKSQRIVIQENNFNDFKLSFQVI